jgi:SAM-dependent methyltransferase
MWRDGQMLVLALALVLVFALVLALAACKGRSAAPMDWSAEDKAEVERWRVYAAARAADFGPPVKGEIKLLIYCRDERELAERTHMPAGAVSRADRHWGAWYPKRSEVYEGVPIIIGADGKRTHLDADGQVHECYTLPQGCTLIPTEVFLQTTYPYFVTTEHLTQDSFFSQLARDAGWKLLCDTSIRCRHVDRVTGKVYEKPLGDPPGGRKTILNIGCGMKGENALPAEYQTPTWREIRIDIDPNVQPDIVADMTHLGQVKADAIWSSHQLEHLAAHEVMVALEECRRVLNPGGMLHLEVPNLQAVCEAVARGTIEVDKPLYQSPAGPIAPLDILYGHRASIAEGRSYMTHRTGFTVQTLEKALSDVGFRDISVFGDGLVIHACAYKQGHLSEIRR